MSMPSETTVLSKSSTLTNVHFRKEVSREQSQDCSMFFLLHTGPTDIGSVGSRRKSGKSMTFGSETGLHCLPAYAVTMGEMHSGSVLRGSAISSLSLSGSNQAREGRLVDALAVRGDERRDTLR